MAAFSMVYYIKIHSDTKARTPDPLIFACVIRTSIYPIYRTCNSVKVFAVYRFYFENKMSCYALKKRKGNQRNRQRNQQLIRKTSVKFFHAIMKSLLEQHRCSVIMVYKPKKILKMENTKLPVQELNS